MTTLRILIIIFFLFTTCLTFGQKKRNYRGIQMSVGPYTYLNMPQIPTYIPDVAYPETDAAFLRLSAGLESDLSYGFEFPIYIMASGGVNPFKGNGSVDNVIDPFIAQYSLKAREYYYSIGIGITRLATNYVQVSSGKGVVTYYQGRIGFSIGKIYSSYDLKYTIDSEDSAVAPPSDYYDKANMTAMYYTINYDHTFGKVSGNVSLSWYKPKYGAIESSSMKLGIGIKYLIINNK